MSLPVYDKTGNPNIHRNRDFLLLLQGKFVSNLGNTIHRVAVIWYIISVVGEKDSGLYLAVFSIFTFLPLILLGPISGVYVDRINRKFILVGSDVINGFLLVILGLLTSVNFFPIPSLFIISFFCAGFGAFFNPAVEAVLPTIVSSKNLIKANSYNGVIFRLTLIIGSALAGFLYYGLGIEGIFYLNGISFILSGITEMFIRIPHLHTATQKKKSVLHDFKEGVLFIKNDSTLSYMLIYFLLASFLISPVFTMYLPLIIKYSLNLTVVNLGQLDAIASVGALIGMAIIAKIPSSKKNYKSLFSIFIVTRPLLLCIFGGILLPVFLIYYTNMMNIFFILCIIMFFILTICPILNVPMRTSFQNKTPDNIRGRFFSILATALACTTPLGNVVAGIALDFFNPATLIVASGIFEAVIAYFLIKMLDFDSFFAFADKNQTYMAK